MDDLKPLTSTEGEQHMRVTVTTNEGTVMKIFDSEKGDDLEAIMEGDDPLAEHDFIEGVAIALIQANRAELHGVEQPVRLDN